MDSRTQELREAHDALAGVYAERLADILDEMPIEQSVLGLFTHYVLAHGGTTVGDIGCGTGRLAPYLASRGLQPRGVDLSPEMVRVARRDHPDHEFVEGDVRSLPYADGSLDGALAWYSLMYLPPEERPMAYAELARVIRPGGHFATAFKEGDDTMRRGGRSLPGVGFDIWWQSQQEVQRRVTDAGFRVVFWAGRPAEPDEPQPQAYLIAERV